MRPGSDRVRIATMTNHSLRFISSVPVLTAIVALLLAGLVTSAEAKPRSAPVGNWAGTATYTAPPDGAAAGVQYESSIVISTGRGRGGAVRLTGLIATVRTYCLSGVRDIRVVKPSISGGPKIGNGGGFRYSTMGVEISGILNNSASAGKLTASARGCDLLDGTWTASKRRY